MFNDIFKYEFLTNALVASLLSSIICGIIGVIITEKKLTMMCGGIAHTAYGGVGLGYLLGIEPIIGAAAFSVSSAIAIGTIKRKTKANTDIIISLFWSLGMALGVIFISLMEGYPPDMNAYLFGNILSVTKLDIYLMLILVGITFLFTLMFFNDLKAYMLDSEFAKVIEEEVINGIKDNPAYKIDFTKAKEYTNLFFELVQETPIGLDLEDKFDMLLKALTVCRLNIEDGIFPQEFSDFIVRQALNEKSLLNIKS